MDIMELGAIGEFVGGIVVIGSLIFVGLQVRQSNRLAQAEAVRSYIREYSQNVLTPLAEPAMAERVRRFYSLDGGVDPEPPAELVRILAAAAAVDAAPDPASLFQLR